MENELYLSNYAIKTTLKNEKSINTCYAQICNNCPNL